MNRAESIELSLELGPGDFSLRLDGLILHVTIKPCLQGVATEVPVRVSALPAAVPPETRESADTAPLAPFTPPKTTADPPETANLPEELDYYRQVAHEIYAGIGRLAKEINLSLQDLTLADIIQTNMTTPGERLDQARTQLADVIKMTETATLNILGLVEQIQDDCLSVQTQLQHLIQAPDPAGDDLALNSADQDSKDRWSHLLARGADLDQRLRDLLPSASPSPAPGGAAAPHFPLSETIQIVLEFCGNETVKQHLRSVQAQQDAAFQIDQVELHMSRLAMRVPLEDDFYQFPVEQVLDLLKEHCLDERVKSLLAKMIGSAGKIFPMPVLPLEGHPPEGGHPLEEVAVPSGEPEFLSRWEEFWQDVRNLAAHSTAAPPPSSCSPDPASATVAHKALTQVERITTSLSRITEALSFQDLSGQRLLKVLGLLKQLQVQVLSLLVAAGSKLKIRMDRQELELKEHEIQAQEQLDRMLHTLTAPTTAPEDLDAPVVPEDRPLDQDAINDLLNSMGF